MEPTLIDQLPPQEGPIKDQLFIQTCSTGINKALSVVEQRFSSPSNPDNQLAFHNPTHTRGVIQRTEQILRAIQAANPPVNPEYAFITDKTIALAKLAAAWHDTVQNWEPVEENGMVKRKRAVGSNEEDSANEAVAFMRSANQNSGETIYSEQDMETVKDAILLTVAEFDPEIKSVVQPGFKEHKGNIIAQAVALADLGTAGMDDFSIFKRDMDMLLVEEDLGFADYLTNDGKRTPEEMDQYRQRIIAWMKFEEQFILGRWAQYKTDRDGIDPRAATPINALFTHFDENLDKLVTLLAQRSLMTPAQIIEDVKQSVANGSHAISS